jgi:hypothetical protein
MQRLHAFFFRAFDIKRPPASKSDFFSTPHDAGEINKAFASECPQVFACFITQISQKSQKCVFQEINRLMQSIPVSLFRLVLLKATSSNHSSKYPKRAATHYWMAAQ